ncbi:MAG: diguanylate cyclase [Hydrogenophaga sp.]|nr:diguanylate cyclase [Hydrogenophaga sp.]
MSHPNPTHHNTPPASQAGADPHWVVHMNHVNRSWSWAVLGLLVGVHLWPASPPGRVWLALALQFLLYPQLLYWRARRAPQPFRAEMHNMLFDAGVLGAWSAALGFPLWIAFLFGIGPCINLVAFQGARGVFSALAAHSLGAVVLGLLVGWHWAPDTRLPVALLAIAALSGYLVMYGLGANARTLKLHQVREQLRRNEQALQVQLDEIQLLQTQLKAQVDRDHLTGLYNRRHLAATIDRELARCARDDAPISAMMVDIDHFKRINDTHGHPVGDEVLKAVAGVLTQALRAGDIACRYGGEEFLLLLPGMPLAAAKARAQDICHQVAALRLSAEGVALQVCVSVGVAEAPQNATDAASLIRQADAALYRAKEMGRNRVETSS